MTRLKPIMSLVAAIVIATSGCTDDTAVRTEAESSALAAEFREQVRRFVEDDDFDASARARVLGTTLAHPAGDAFGPGVLEYHRSFPRTYDRLFSDARPEFARIIREHEYAGFVWWRVDTHPSTSDDEPVVLSAWGEPEFIVQVRAVVEDAAAATDAAAGVDRGDS